MGEKLESETRAGFSPDQLLALSGLKVAINPSAWGFWREAMPAGPEVVNVTVASVEFDKDGTPVAFGVRRSEMLRTIKEHGDINHNSAEIVGIEPNRVVMFTADGSETWPPFKFETKPTKPINGIDAFDVPYI